MDFELKLAQENALEWWDIFKMTGDWQDAIGLVEAFREYDLLLENEGGMEL